MRKAVFFASSSMRNGPVFMKVLFSSILSVIVPLLSTPSSAVFLSSNLIRHGLISPTVVPVNDAPVLDDVPDQITDEDVPLTIELSASDIDAEIVRLQAEYDAQEYARNRAIAYASIGDQLDMQYWDSVNDTTTWKDHIASVKGQFPKV